jgi:hypothetical protein
MTSTVQVRGEADETPAFQTSVRANRMELPQQVTAKGSQRQELRYRNLNAFFTPPRSARRGRWDR